MKNHTGPSSWVNWYVFKPTISSWTERDWKDFLNNPIWHEDRCYGVLGWTVPVMLCVTMTLLGY
jgi:hypothetical protein